MKKYRVILYLILFPLLMIFLYFAGVIGYGMITDYRPAPQENMSTYGQGSVETLPDTLSIVTWNIGYAGLGAESDFFYDGGKTVRMPAAVVKKNLEGISAKLRDWRNEVDVFFLQEVDRSAKRSWDTDQFADLKALLPGFAGVFAPNYVVKFIPIPFQDPMGHVNAGITTFSKSTPTSSVRHSYEGNFDWPTYLFFLDRCFLLQRFPVADGKELVLINTHNSAYDDGTLKQRQMIQLKEVLLDEYALGNYVIVGGDWNQYPATYTGHPGFEWKKTEENAKFFVPEVYPDTGWTWAWDPAAPTNRQLRTSFIPSSTPRVVLDYFLLSPNVALDTVTTFDEAFKYSDHNPVKVKVRLKRESDPVEEVLSAS